MSSFVIFSDYFLLDIVLILILIFSDLILTRYFFANLYELGISLILNW